MKTIESGVLLSPADAHKISMVLKLGADVVYSMEADKNLESGDTEVKLLKAILALEEVGITAATLRKTGG